MKPTNVISMNFKSANGIQEFIDMYERYAYPLYPQAKLIVLVKTYELSIIAYTAYP